MAVDNTKVIHMRPFEQAWNLLKGNPHMRDEHGQSIDQPAAALYANLRNRIDTPGLGEFGYTPADVLESFADSYRGTPAAKRSFFGPSRNQHDVLTEGRNLTSRNLNRQGTPKPMLGVQRQDRNEVEHPNKPESTDDNFGELSHLTIPEINQMKENEAAEMERIAQERRDFEQMDPQGNYFLPAHLRPPPPPPTTDVQMQPGNVMDLM